jgi:hypothetical protein
MKRTRDFLLITGMIAGMFVTLTGCGGGGGGKNGVPPLPIVAVLSNEAATLFATDVVEKLEATGKFSLVDTINAATSTPALPQLLTYDGVLVYTGEFGSAIFDTTALGDVLANFVDQGGGLVVAFAAVVYKPSFPELALGGRYVSGQYYLIPRVDSAYGSQVSAAVWDSTHPIMAGFTSFNGGSVNAWADTTLVVPGADVILEWADGKPLVVVSETAGIGNDQRRVDLNFYPPSSDTDSRFWVATTDGDKLMANSLTWVANSP